MINIMFFVFFACVFEVGISIVQYQLPVSPFISLALILVATIGMLATIKEVIKKLKNDNKHMRYTQCKNCIWAVWTDKYPKGFICKKNPFNPVFMGRNGKHLDRKYRIKRAKK